MASAEAAYAKYARQPASGMKVEELRALLSDLGLLAGRPAHAAREFVVQQFAQADRRSRDSVLDFAEFAAFYSKVTAPRLLDALSADMPGEMEALRGVFLGFAAFGAQRGAAAPTELDGARFIKLCRESGLTGRQLSATDCDLIFARAKERAARRLSFEQFLDTLDMIAAKTGAPLATVVRQVAAARGPAANGVTTAEFVRFHDESPAAGTAARRSSGGPQRPDEGGSADLRATQPSHSTAAAGAAAAAGGRRRSSLGSGQRGSAGGAGGSMATPGRSGGQQQGSSAISGGEACTPGVQSRDSLRETFQAFATFGLGSSPQPSKGGPLMDSKQFIKLCRDSGILGGRLTATAADLAFVAKAKPLGARKLSFPQFLAAVEQLAVEKGVAKEELYAAIANCRGPSLRGALTPDQTADPFSSRHATLAAPATLATCATLAADPVTSRHATLTAGAAAAATGPTLAAGAAAAATGPMLAAGAAAAAGQAEQHCREVEAEAEQDATSSASSSALCAAAVAAGVGKLSLGGRGVINITATTAAV